MQALTPIIQRYNWGSYDFLPEFLNLPKDGQPYAELWYGTHVRGESVITETNEPLSKHIGGSLPYMMKVLSAERPLSIQVHPNKKLAEEGYRKEEDQKIARQNPQRNYPDPNHKPEILIALSDVWALSSIRPKEEIISFLENINSSFVEKKFNTIEDLFSTLLRIEHDNLFLQTILEFAKKNTLEKHDLHWWVLEMARYYSNDVGIIMPYILNLVHLSPGEALFNAPGELHAYLKGSGIEVMSCSDNVLRCACTQKYKDVEELFRITSFSSRSPSILQPKEVDEGLYEYPVETLDFQVFSANQGKRVACPLPSGLGIVLCTEGYVQVSQEEEKKYLKRGENIFCTTDLILIEGPGRACIVTNENHMG